MALIEYHFVLFSSFLCFSGVENLKTLYNLLKTASVFVSLHNHDTNNGHIHLITQENEKSKGQKIQNLVRKLKGKMANLDSKKASSYLKLFNTNILESERLTLAGHIKNCCGTENNSSLNCLSKGNAFSVLMRNLKETIQSKNFQCLEKFPPGLLNASGFTVEETNNDFDYDHDQDQDDDEMEDYNEISGEPKKLVRSSKKVVLRETFRALRDHL